MPSSSVTRHPLTTLSTTADRIRHPTDTADFSSSTAKSSRPKAQDEQSAAKRKEEHDAIESAVDEWVSNTLAKAAELGDKFDKRPRYFLDRFFHGGQKLIYKQNVTNSFNAFISIKAAQLRIEGEKENVIELQKRFKAEYDGLTPEERAGYVTEFNAIKDNSIHIPRATSRGCIQDIGNVARNIERLLESLKTRVGVEGFFCIVRNNTQFYIDPVWYFTAQQLEDYMPVAVGRKWNSTDVAAKLESFAIAGCDVISGCFKFSHFGNS
ncbi:hypothetical protein BDN70DRAFT_819271 [Pholiota conissans]|uniref:Uncharacterized protein n=1 Tax=Pholiota conissans TaxID=109636 RepID=A0A9P5YNU9_9AGAR|nr:hypothetical protein BDN70DRAFT_819271 [Pholiota conissans]